jgi:hypothetical protein
MFIYGTQFFNKISDFTSPFKLNLGMINQDDQITLLRK